MKKIIQSPEAPAPVGPYSQAVQCGNLLFLSGQIPIDPATGKLVPGGIQEQTEQVLKNIRAVLAAAGTGPEQILKTTVFLTDLANFSAMNEIYAQHFSSQPPARSTIQISALPMGANVEIEAVANIPQP